MKITKLKNIITIIIILTFFIPGRANSKNCLWRVKSSNNIVYLQGSVHYLKKESYPLNQPIEQAFQDSQVIVFEIDFEIMNDLKTQQLVLEKSLLGEGETFKELISTETYDLVAAEMKKIGLDISSFHNYKPWAMIMALVVYKLQMLGYSQQDGLDYYFYNKAMTKGKEVIGLETVEQQLGYFEKMDFLDQDDLLCYSLEDLSVLEDEIKYIIKAWSTGDINALESIILKSFKQYPVIYKILLIDRNKKWLPKIESFLKMNKNFMIIIGTGHIVGKDSLVELLKNKGYSVEQL